MIFTPPHPGADEYIRKPASVDAMQFRGDATSPGNHLDILRWIDRFAEYSAQYNQTIYSQKRETISGQWMSEHLTIYGINREFELTPGDWLVCSEAKLFKLTSDEFNEKYQVKPVTLPI